MGAQKLPPPTDSSRNRNHHIIPTPKRSPQESPLRRIPATTIRALPTNIHLYKCLFVGTEKIGGPMFSMTWLLAIVATCISIAILNRLTKGVIYGTLQIGVMLIFAIIALTYLSVYEFITDLITHTTQKAVLSLLLIVVICLGIWAWVFWGWFFNL